MKRPTVARFMYFISIVLSLLIWAPGFFWFWPEGDMDSTSVSLFELAESYNKAALGHSLKLGAVLALICGSLPFLTGLFGFVLPRAKALLVVSIASFAIIVVSGVVFYVWISSIDQLHVMKMGFGLGAYITCVILVLEISAGIISRYKAAP